MMISQSTNIKCESSIRLIGIATINTFLDNYFRPGLIGLLPVNVGAFMNII